MLLVEKHFENEAFFIELGIFKGKKEGKIQQNSSNELRKIMQLKREIFKCVKGTLESNHFVTSLQETVFNNEINEPLQFYYHQPFMTIRKAVIKLIEISKITKKLNRKEF